MGQSLSKKQQQNNEFINVVPKVKNIKKVTIKQHEKLEEGGGLATPRQVDSQRALPLEKALPLGKALHFEKARDNEKARDDEKACDDEKARDDDEKAMPETMRKCEKMALYENDCTKIIDGVYISGIAVAQNEAIIAQHGITHIVNLAYETIPNHFKDTLKYLSFKVRDGPCENICFLFYRIFYFIQQAVQGNGRVLVHCHAGVSRSCSMTIAYLMWKNSISYTESFNVVKAKRGVCSPNAGFICQLLEYEKVLLRPNCHPDRCLYTMAVYSNLESTLVLQPVWEKGTRDSVTIVSNAFTATGCFVLQTLTSWFIWKGKDCRLENVLEVCTLDIENICTFEKRKKMSIVEEIQGHESEAFLAHFNDFTIAASSTATSNQLSPPSAPQLDNSEVIPITKEVPTLWMYTSASSFESILNYDSEDLLPDKAFILLDQNRIFLWIGSHANLDIDKTLIQIRSHFSVLSNAITVVEEGKENDDFWQLYEQGY